jgi:hypothetical protein
MKERLVVALLTLASVGLASLVLVSIFTGGSEADAPITKTCPQGQVLVGGKAGGLTFRTNALLPPGWRIHDSERGGLGVELTTTRRSATVEPNVPLTIECEVKP